MVGGFFALGWADSFIASRVTRRFTSQGGRFFGYEVNIYGVKAFLPASKGAWFFPSSTTHAASAPP